MNADEPDGIDAEFDAAMEPRRRMSHAEQMARASFGVAASMIPVAVAAPPKPTVGEWQRAFRYDYVDDDAGLAQGGA
jgi:hypothetical protein